MVKESLTGVFCVMLLVHGVSSGLVVDSTICNVEPFVNIEEVTSGVCRCMDGFVFSSVLGQCLECGYGFYASPRPGDNSVDSDVCHICTVPGGHFAFGCGGDHPGVSTECSLCPEQEMVNGTVYDVRVALHKHCGGVHDTLCEICDICEKHEYESQPCGGEDPFARQCLSCMQKCPVGQFVPDCENGVQGLCIDCVEAASVLCSVQQYLEGCGGVLPGTCIDRPICGEGKYLSFEYGGAYNERGECRACKDCDEVEVTPGNFAGMYRHGCGGMNSGTCEVSMLLL